MTLVFTAESWFGFTFREWMRSILLLTLLKIDLFFFEGVHDPSWRSSFNSLLVLCSALLLLWLMTLSRCQIFGSSFLLCHYCSIVKYSFCWLLMRIDKLRFVIMWECWKRGLSLCFAPCFICCKSRECSITDLYVDWKFTGNMGE